MRWGTVALLLLSGVAGAETRDEMRALSAALRAAVERVAPCVVTVETFGGIPVVKNLPERKDDQGRRLPSPLRRPGVSPGPGPTSGTVISSDGWIVASAFAFVDEPTTIIVTMSDGRSLPAKLFGRDLSRGVALLKVEAKGLPVPEAAPPEEIRVGQWAASVGRGLTGESPMVQIGIVSAVDRISGRAVQTDALTSPANFGGPLIDLRGRLIGVIIPLSRRGLEAAVRSYDSGIGFAVPLARITPVLSRLKAGAMLHPAYLGVGVVTGSTEEGAPVTSVLPGSPASGAGLQKGDVILEVDGEKLLTGFALLDAIGRHVAGESMRLRWRRGEETHEAEVTLVRRPEKTPKSPVEAEEDEDEKKEKDGDD
jgi:serine protease Do